MLFLEILQAMGGAVVVGGAGLHGWRTFRKHYRLRSPIERREPPPSATATQIEGPLARSDSSRK